MFSHPVVFPRRRGTNVPPIHRTSSCARKRGGGRALLPSFLVVFFFVFFFFLSCHDEGRGSGWRRAQAEVSRLRARSFPGVKALLELGALVAEVEALFADGVVTVKADEHDAPGRVDALPGLRRGRST